MLEATAERHGHLPAAEFFHSCFISDTSIAAFMMPHHHSGSASRSIPTDDRDTVDMMRSRGVVPCPV